MLCTFIINFTKISSHGLIYNYEQFDLNYSTKHIISQKYFVNTIHMNSETLGLLFTANQPISVPLCEPEFHSHSRPHTHHNKIYFIIYEINIQNSPNTISDCTNGLQKLQQFGSKIWDRSNSRSRPQTNQNIHKTLKQSVTSSRMKPLPHGVCRNSKKSVPTHCPRHVERLSFLLRRNPTVESPVILERSCILSH